MFKILECKLSPASAAGRRYKEAPGAGLSRAAFLLRTHQAHGDYAKQAANDPHQHSRREEAVELL